MIHDLRTSTPIIHAMFDCWSGISHLSVVLLVIHKHADLFCNLMRFRPR